MASTVVPGRRRVDVNVSIMCGMGAVASEMGVSRKTKLTDALQRNAATEQLMSRLDSIDTRLTSVERTLNEISE